MKNSNWLQEYEKEVKGKRDKSNQSKKIILIVIPIMMIIFLIATMANGGASDSQTQSGMIYNVGICVFVFLFAIIMMCKGKKIDVAKETRENVLSLLRTDQEVDCFDQQMNTAPIMEEKIATETTVFLTKDYMGQKYFALGDLKYRFARREDIVALNYCKTASTGANPMKASYFFDVRNAENEIILNGTAETARHLEGLEALLKVANPNLVVTKKGLLG